MFTAQAFARSEGYYPTELSHGQYGPRSDVYSFGIVRQWLGSSVQAVDTHTYFRLSLRLSHHLRPTQKTEKTGR